MQLTRRRESWEPRRDLEELSSRFTRLFGLSKWMGNGEHEPLSMADWSPSCDISETDAEYRISAELPNVKKEDVHVTLENGVLTIQGERREEKEAKGVRFRRRELAYGNFIRRFTMPDDADATKVDASFQDGMLNVVIPRAKAKEPTTLEIAIH